MLHPIASVGTDGSAAVRERLRPQVESAALTGVTLQQLDGNGFAGIPAESVDLVIINAVVEQLRGVDDLGAALGRCR